jgi:hypothetical protein
MYRSNFLKKYKKFIIPKNKKTTYIKWSKSYNHTKDDIDTNKYNYGILTGEQNNLIVLDIDVQDDGIQEFNKYIEKYGDIKTFIQKSPSGGKHYFFTFKHSISSVQHLINFSLTNSTKYRGKGLDIRSNGGYIVGAGSTIDNKKYEIINNIKPIEIPESLVLWLLENRNIKKTTNKKDKKFIVNKNNNQYKFYISDNEIKNILDKLYNLDKSYCDNYNEWLVVLSVLKSLNKYDIFEEFSKKCPNKYHKERNLYFWNVNEGLIDINYLIHIINNLDKNSKPIELIQRYKPFENILCLDKIKTLNINAEKLEIDNELFDNYDTIIFESAPGTGKTTHTIKQLKRYLKLHKNKYRIITLVNLITLSKQQLKVFNENNIDITSYTDPNKDIENDNIVICLNSLAKVLNYLPDDYFDNVILYIDEINSFLEYLTTCSLLDKNIRHIYEVLVKLIKRSHKVILSDAHINQNVFNFIKKRNNDTKLYVNNFFKKYQGIKAVNIKDENIFIKKINDDIKANKYFLFGCDSCDTITKLFNECLKNNPDKKNDMILITSESPFDIIDANEQFKNKWVFYSPSIVTGVDFSIDVKQNHYIYVKGFTINPLGIYQQSTRNRNISTLFYYFDTKQHDAVFNSIEDVKKFYKNVINATDKINNVCRQFNEFDESYINENNFFELYCFVQYQNDVYNTNKKIHYELILQHNGFILSVEGETNKITKEKQKELNDLADNTKIIDEYLNTDKNIRDTDIKFKPLRDNIEGFKLDTDKDIKTYEGILTNKFERRDYFNFIKLIQSDETNKQNIAYLNNSSYTIKELDTVDNKIKIIKKLYSTHNIEYLSLDKFDTIEKINITDDEYYNVIKPIFRSTVDKPINNDEFKKMIFKILKNLVGNTKIIESKNKTDGKNINKNINIYYWNKNNIKFYIDLYKKYNDDLRNINIKLSFF